MDTRCGQLCYLDAGDVEMPQDVRMEGVFVGKPALNARPHGLCDERGSACCERNYWR